jgi:hypothetical protein
LLRKNEIDGDSCCGKAIISRPVVAHFREKTEAPTLAREKKNLHGSALRTLAPQQTTNRDIAARLPGRTGTQMAQRKENRQPSSLEAKTEADGGADAGKVKTTDSTRRATSGEGKRTNRRRRENFGAGRRACGRKHGRRHGCGRNRVRRCCASKKSRTLRRACGRK